MASKTRRGRGQLFQIGFETSIIRIGQMSSSLYQATTTCTVQKLCLAIGMLEFCYWPRTDVRPMSSVTGVTRENLGRGVTESTERSDREPTIDYHSLCLCFLRTNFSTDRQLPTCYTTMNEQAANSPGL